MTLKKMDAHEPSSTALSDHDKADDAQTLSISVVVPVRNEAKFIRRTLTQLATQRYDSERFEIIVVDGQSTDDTRTIVAEFVERYDNVHLLSNSRQLSSAARNVGIRHARGDAVVVVDGHCEIEDDRFLSKLAMAFSVSGADCLGRPQPLDLSDAGTLQRAIAAARSSWLGHHPDSFIYSSQQGFVPAGSVAVAYRRSVFEKVGYFDENFDACEDFELNHRLDRAGLRCYFTPEIAVHYFPRGNLHGLFRQMVRYGRGRIRLLRKHPDTFAIRTLLPAVFLAGGVLGLLVCWLWAPLAAVYVGALATYLAAVLTVSIMIGIRHRDLWLFPWLPVVFLTVHVAAGMGLLIEALWPLRRRKGNGRDGATSGSIACGGPGRHDNRLHSGNTRRVRDGNDS